MSKQIHQLRPVVPLPLPEVELQEIIEKAKDWALMHGLGMRSKNEFSKDSLTFAPFLLLPSPFPRREFDKAISLQVLLNELTHRVAHDDEFLRECLKETVRVDEFTGNLFKIYETVQQDGVAQPLSLGMVRSDYLLEVTSLLSNRKSQDTVTNCTLKQVEINTIAAGFSWLGYQTNVSLGLLRSDYMIQANENNKIKQVEINTIASSFGGLTSNFKNFNRYVLQQLGLFNELVNLPQNNCLHGLSEGLIEAWKIYGSETARILFIVEDVTYNICDQRFHEFEVANINPLARVIRRTLTEIADRAYLKENNELVVDNHEVAVVYFRAGYEPGHYPSQKEWDARLLIERSLAIKSPSIQYHLAGTKKVQQELACNEALERFVSNSQEIKAIKDVFTGLYSLDFDEMGDQAIQMALSNPENYVLKPQREGGGNNVYGVNIRDAIASMENSEERTAWILMERINPPTTPGYMIRPGGPKIPEVVDLVSELGIYGLILGDSKKIYTNRQVGHMLRTKLSDVNEGGVIAGLGALDSPYLID